jgi:hypothetical protein
MKFTTGLITIASTAFAHTSIGSLHGYPPPKFVPIEQLFPEYYATTESTVPGSSI